MKTLTRGQLAHASGVGGEAIRFYERRGLLPPTPRSAAGYRRFATDTVQRLRFIRRAKDLGFSLQEVGELLALHDDEHGDRARVKAIAERNVANIEGKLHDLRRMRAMLADLAARCSGRGPIGGCAIIDALADEPPASSPAPTAHEVIHERRPPAPRARARRG